MSSSAKAVLLSLFSAGSWLGVAVREQTFLPSEQVQHNFLDLAKNYDWFGVNAQINEFPDLLNVQPGGRYSVLHQAAEEGNAEEVQFLLSKGANKNALTKGGQTAKDLAPNSLKQMLSDIPLTSALPPTVFVDWEVEPFCDAEFCDFGQASWKRNDNRIRDYLLKLFPLPGECTQPSVAHGQGNPCYTSQDLLFVHGCSNKEGHCPAEQEVTNAADAKTYMEIDGADHQLWAVGLHAPNQDLMWATKHAIMYRIGNNPDPWDMRWSYSVRKRGVPDGTTPGYPAPGFRIGTISVWKIGKAEGAAFVMRRFDTNLSFGASDDRGAIYGRLGYALNQTVAPGAPGSYVFTETARARTQLYPAVVFRLFPKPLSAL